MQCIAHLYVRTDRAALMYLTQRSDINVDYKVVVVVVVIVK